MHRNVDLLTNVPAARLFDEFLKLFQCGHAESTFDFLREHELFAEMFPATDQELDEDETSLRLPGPRCRTRIVASQKASQ